MTQLVCLCRARPGAEWTATDISRVQQAVANHLSSLAVPSHLIPVAALPETYSGKYMRRLLHALVDDEPLGDLGALKNPDCVVQR